MLAFSEANIEAEILIFPSLITSSLFYGHLKNYQLMAPGESQLLCLVQRGYKLQGWPCERTRSAWAIVRSAVRWPTSILSSIANRRAMSFVSSDPIGRPASLEAPAPKINTVGVSIKVVPPLSSQPSLYDSVASGPIMTLTGSVRGPDLSRQRRLLLHPTLCS